MALLGLYLAAAALLVVAGAAKALQPRDTSRALATSLRWWPRRTGTALVRAAAAAEAALGVVALVHPVELAAAAVAGSYTAFALFVLHAYRRGGALSTCGCFGAPDTPPTLLHAGIDALFVVAAVAVAASAHAGSLGVLLDHQWRHGVPLCAGAALLAWLTWLVLVPLARLGFLRRMAP